MLDPSRLRPGHEQYERFKSAANKKLYYAYDYRHANGELFSCIKPTMEQARAAIDEWLNKKRG